MTNNVQKTDLFREKGSEFSLIRSIVAIVLTICTAYNSSSDIDKELVLYFLSVTFVDKTLQ